MSSIASTSSGRNAQNVAPLERWASAFAGGGLVWLGLRRRSLPGLGWAALGGALLERGWSGHCRAYQALGVDTAAGREPLLLLEAMQVTVSPIQAYQVWRDLQNLPRFMRHLESVTPGPLGRSRWRAKLDGGPTIDWEAEIVEDTPSQVLAWRSLPDSDVMNSGTVRFFELPAGRGTGVRVEIAYRPPAGALGETAARFLTPVLRLQVREDVRRFKSMVEAGEIPTTEGQPFGKSEPAQEVQP